MLDEGQEQADEKADQEQESRVAHSMRTIIVLASGLLDTSLAVEDK
jgi:hypothetical protein